MAKLHEILAVEQSLEKAAKKLAEESKKTFNKENLFKGHTRRLEYFDENNARLNTTENVKLETTVDENLDYVMQPLAKHWDAVYQKDQTNQQAKADILIGNDVLAKDIPATFLLGLESKLGKLRELYEAIPTLPPGIKWKQDDNQRQGVFIAEDDIVQFKSEKDIEFKVAYEATKEHPAQVKELQKTINIGKYTTTHWCAMLTPLNKANRLAKIDELLNAVKKARQRANNTQIVDGHIGITLLNYINSK
jgi:hypothetical protein